MIKDKMTPYYKTLKGGLFESTSKADVGNNADKMKQDGVAMLSWADPFYPDFSLENYIKETIEKSLADGSGQHYTTPVGNSELKTIIAEKLKKDNNLNVDPFRNIIITPGSDPAILFSLIPFIEPNDEVMLLNPSYPNNYQAVKILGGIPVSIDTDENNNYQIDISKFEAKLTKRTKAIILTNPNNPTTTVYSQESLMALAKFAKDNDIIVIVDQAFEDVIFDERQMITFASLPDMFERTITIFSISKGLGLSGLRVGYIVADDVIMDTLYASAVSVVGATNSASQLATIEAYKRRYEIIDNFKMIFEARRKMVYEQLSNIPGVKVCPIESSFLSWINISKLGTSEQIVDYLIKEAKVNVNAGNFYGSNGEGYIRICHGCYKDDQMILQAIIRIRQALLKRSKELGL